MNEFIEKLIGRLEEYKYSHLIERNSEQCEHCKDIEDCENRDCSLCIWDKSISIVNQLAEEYNNSNDSMEIQIAKNYAKWLTKCGINVTEKWLTATEQAYALNEAYIRGIQDEMDKFAEWQSEHNNGWIASSEDKPKKNGWYECWYMTSSVGENKYYEPITLYWEDNIWLYRSNKFTMPTQSNVVAWKPIAPYQPKGE